MTDKRKGTESEDLKTSELGQRDFAGTSIAANEQEQTDDRRGKNDAEEGDIADGGISPRLNDDGKL